VVGYRSWEDEESDQNEEAVAGELADFGSQHSQQDEKSWKARGPDHGPVQSHDHHFSRRNVGRTVRGAIVDPFGVARGLMVDVGRRQASRSKTTSPATEIEFDSDDSDECEDIFSGTWDAEVVVGRRSKKMVAFMKPISFH